MCSVGVENAKMKMRTARERRPCSGLALPGGKREFALPVAKSPGSPRGVGQRFEVVGGVESSAGGPGYSDERSAVIVGITAVADAYRENPRAAGISLP